MFFTLSPIYSTLFKPQTPVRKLSQAIALLLLSNTALSATNVTLSAIAKEQSGSSITNAIDIQNERLNTRFIILGQALIQSSGAIASYEEKVKNEWRNQAAYEQLKQGTNRCEKLINQGKLNAFNTMSKFNAERASRIMLNEMFSTKSQGLREQEQYQANLNQFCSTSQFIEGECDKAASPELQYAHVDANILYGSSNSTTRPNDLDVARDSLINILSGTSSIPSSAAIHFDEYGTEIIPETPQAERYENARQRWIALTSLTRDALYRASESHTYAPMDIHDFNNTITLTNTNYIIEHEGQESVLNQRAKEKQPFTVVILGNSHTAWKIFPAAVEKTLQKVNTTAKVQTIATNGATFEEINKFHPNWLDSLVTYNPDLVILNYGTNESANETIGGTESKWQSQISMMKSALPDAHFLIVGAPETLDNQNNECGTRPQSLDRIQTMQKRLSEQFNTAFWSWQDAMGGQCSMKKNLFEKLSKTEPSGSQVVHFTGNGYQKYGQMLGEFILGEQQTLILRSKVTQANQGFAPKYSGVKIEARKTIFNASIHNFGLTHFKSFLDNPTVFTSDYGPRDNTKLNGGSQHHQGYDLRAPIGTTIRSPFDNATIKYVGYQSGAGNMIVVCDHINNCARFMHNSKIVVKEGQKVNNSTIIAYSGNTGGVGTGPHIHIDLYNSKGEFLAYDGSTLAGTGISDRYVNKAHRASYKR